MLRIEWFRPKKLRVLLAWIGAPFLFIYSNVSDLSFLWGVILMAAGELIRLWSLGFVEKKGKELAMNGPYAFTRNPLYVGNFFLGLGLVTIAANWICPRASPSPACSRRAWSRTRPTAPRMAAGCGSTATTACRAGGFCMACLPKRCAIYFE